MGCKSSKLAEIRLEREELEKANKKAKAALEKAGGKGRGGALPLADAAAPPPKATGAALLALRDRQRQKGQDKGKGKGKASNIPRGIRSKTEDNKPICFAFNAGELCVMPQCQMAHVCWWCPGAHAGGNSRTTACA